MARFRLMDPRQALREHIKGKSRDDAAKELGISRQYLWFLLTGKRPFTDTVLRQIGMEKEVRFKVARRA